MDNVIGHKDIIHFFDRARAEKRLAHAYCFIGQEHVGRRWVAKNLAASILGVPITKLAVTPDFVSVEQSFDEKKGKTNKDIEIEQIRHLQDMLQLKPYLGGYKVGMIDQAEKMNTKTANAFLKTLEEPSGKTILILIITDESQLPATILSRCQNIYFHPVVSGEIQEALVKKGVIDNQAGEIARLSHGLPGLAVEWSQHAEAYEAYKEDIQRFASLLGKPLAEKIKVIEPLLESGDDHIAARLRLKDMLSLWQLLLRDMTQIGKQIHTLPSQTRLSTGVYVEVLSRIDRAQTLLEENIHPRLLLEHILVRIP